MPPLSPKFNNDVIDNKIYVGSVVSIEIEGIDHPKWNIILALTDDKYLVASVFINSEINYKHINSKDLRDLQYEIDTKYFKFLDHNSFVDCSKIYSAI